MRHCPPGRPRSVRQRSNGHPTYCTNYLRDTGQSLPWRQLTTRKKKQSRSRLKCGCCAAHVSLPRISEILARGSGKEKESLFFGRVHPGSCILKAPAGTVLSRPLDQNHFHGVVAILTFKWTSRATSVPLSDHLESFSEVLRLVAVPVWHSA